MKFTKMQGCGNDYVYINGLNNTINNPIELSKKISNRNFGVGSDGLVLILPSETADFKMRMFNPDGTEASMCGNAIRCVGKYVYERGYHHNNIVNIETLSGIKTVHLITEGNLVKEIQVDMGEPILEAEKIPVCLSDQDIEEIVLTIKDTKFPLTCVSMGNPHAVTFLDNIQNFEISELGHHVENATLFPERTNVEFVQVLDDKNVLVRVWERGAGETLACGTGACATLVACVLRKLTDRQITVHLRGGDLKVEWNQNSNHVWMSGPAEFVFEGQWLLSY